MGTCELPPQPAAAQGTRQARTRRPCGTSRGYPSRSPRLSRSALADARLGQCFVMTPEAAAKYHPFMDGDGFMLSDQAAYPTATGVLPDSGVMQWSVGL